MLLKINSLLESIDNTVLLSKWTLVIGILLIISCAMAAVSYKRRMELRESKQFTDLLINTYDGVYRVDLKHDTVSAFRQSEKRAKKSQNISQYSEFIKKYIDEFIVEDDRPTAHKLLNIGSLREKLPAGGTSELIIREGEPERFQFVKIHVVKDGYGFIAALSISDVDSIIREERRQQKELAEARDKASRQTVILEKTVFERTSEIREKNRQLSRMNDEIVELMGGIVEYRNQESGEHIRRVKGFSRILAEEVMKLCPEYNLTPNEINLISSASALHDIGKITVPDAVLLKPGKLTKEEFEIIKTHSANGALILKEQAPRSWSSEYLKMSLQIAGCHHEKWDGSGYPDGLKGDDIPISAQIVSVADCYDALTTKRVYKDAYTPDTAYEMISGGRCGAFSPKLMQCFFNCRGKFKKLALEMSDAASALKEELPAELSNDTLKNMRIMVVDDTEISLEINADVLEAEGAEVVKADSGSNAIEVYSDMVSNGANFDAIVLDIVMEPIDGIDTVREIRKFEAAYPDLHVPVIMLTADADKTQIKKALDAGADSWMYKPLVMDDFIRAFNSIISSSSIENVYSENKNRMDLISDKDPLTGVNNLLAYTRYIADLSDRIKNDRSLKFAVVLSDIESLREINTHFGCEAGDSCLRNCAAILQRVFVHSNIYRLNGDEFAVILEDSEYEKRGILFNELRTMADSAAVVSEFSQGRVVFNTGMAVYEMKRDLSFSEVMERASVALYNSKLI